jgi:hypothetical protein
MQNANKVAKRKLVNVNINTTPNYAATHRITFTIAADHDNDSSVMYGILTLLANLRNARKYTLDLDNALKQSEFEDEYIGDDHVNGRNYIATALQALADDPSDDPEEFQLAKIYFIKALLQRNLCMQYNAYPK